MSRANIALILNNPFYAGQFVWGGQTFADSQPLFIEPALCSEVQAVLKGHTRPKYSKREIAFRGLMLCTNDGCMLTGDIQEESTCTIAALGTGANATCRGFAKKI